MSRIPMLDLVAEYQHYQEEIDAAIKQCLNHQHWIMGPEVKQLEEELADYLGVKHCIGVSSGTDALVLSLRCLALQLKGQEYFSAEDEIITTPFTFTATGDAILRSGATPVFLDIDPNTFNLDTTKVGQYLQQSKQVVGIMPVHLYGQACDMDSIMQTAKQHNCFVLEDVAQAFGAEWREQKLGTIGVSGAFSFFPSKNLGCFGDGGMIASNSDEVAELARMLMKHGGKDKYNVDHVGYNARLDTLQAAVLSVKLKYIDEFNRLRGDIAAAYSQAFEGLVGCTTPHIEPHAKHVYHQYTLRVENRDNIQAGLSEAGVSSMVYYPVPLHQMKVFKGRSIVGCDLSESEKASQQVLSLPIEPLQKQKATDKVILSLKSLL